MDKKATCVESFWVEEEKRSGSMEGIAYAVCLGWWIRLGK
jgi:hypothetical protein